ncbi:hypothetical protein BGZ94_010419 [Podila epigama]|nr:hypothetical protein BGZ94_010419 [Podila epigama]
MASTSPQLPLEIWLQILTQTLNMLLPISTTPRTYSTNILPLLLTSHTFHEHCHPVTAPHLRKHKLLQLFTRWKAAHSREVHFYHHPLRNHVRYALPDRVGNPPGEEYETLYSFIKRAYLFGCESVCGTVIPVEGGLDGNAGTVAAPVPNGQAQEAAPLPAQGNNNTAQNEGHGAVNAAAPPASTGPGGNVVVAPPPAIAPAAAAPGTHHPHGNDGGSGGQGWKGHALQWHVANPTFAAEGTIEMYKDVVEEYRRMVCGSRAASERSRELERTMDMIRNPHKYTEADKEDTTGSGHEQKDTKTVDLDLEDSMSQDGDGEEYEEDDEYEDDEDDEDVYEDSDLANDDGEEQEYDQEEQEMMDDDNELLNEIEAKGGLRRRDSGHAQSSSEMDIDDDDDEKAEQLRRAATRAAAAAAAAALRQDADFTMDPSEEGQQQQQGHSRPSKREPETTTTDYQLEGSGRHHRGLRSRKAEREQDEQERLIMDMALDKPYHAMGSLSPFHPLDSSAPASSSSSSSSSCSSSSSLSSPLSSLPDQSSAAPVRKSSRSKKERALRDSRTSRVNRRRRQQKQERSGAESQSSAPSSASQPNADASVSSTTPVAESSTSSTKMTADDLGFDLASACANTFASDLAFVLARVPGLGAHFHRFEQLAKLKLHVGWAKHAQSRGGNDVFVMSCSRLIGLLAPLANTPLVSERGG